MQKKLLLYMSQFWYLKTQFIYWKLGFVQCNHFGPNKKMTALTQKLILRQMDVQRCGIMLERDQVLQSQKRNQANRWGIYV